MVINIADDQSGFKAQRCKFHIFLTLLMLNMIIIIQAIEDITHDNEFKELQKFQLNEEDWDLLKVYQQILQVIF